MPLIPPITVPLLILCGLVCLVCVSVMLFIPLPQFIKGGVVRILNSSVVFRSIIIFCFVCAISAYNSYFGFKYVAPFEQTIQKGAPSLFSQSVEKYYRYQRTFYLSLFALYAGIAVLAFTRLSAKLNQVVSEQGARKQPNAPKRD
mmetsp:Transcript_11608/g.43599  ORF Transcript_11608/g.43599 Transcript_11608/m.43599 type:complete len:145 (-) Transcript_11608:137-571(-)